MSRHAIGIAVTVEGERRMGSGNCSYRAPGVFGLDAGIAVVDAGSAAAAVDPAGHGDEVRPAAERGPTAAISIDGPRAAPA